MSRRRNRNGGGGVRVSAGDVIVTGNRQQVIERLELLGEDAERERDFPKAHSYYQAAEHHKRAGDPAAATAP